LKDVTPARIVVVGWQATAVAAQRTVAVASGKGGVGKSTVSLNLALALSERGQRVGLLDADLYGPDLALMVGVTRRTPTKGVTIWRNRAVSPDPRPAIKPLERFGIQLMSAQFLVAEDQALAWSRPLVELLLQRFATDLDWGELDTLIVDLPPGTADVQQMVAERLQLTGALLVVTPQDVAHLDAKKVVAMFERSRVPVLGAVENMSGLRCPCCATDIDVFPRVAEERSLWARGIECLGRIPLDPSVASAGDRGQPLLVTNPESVPAEAFRHLTDRLVGAFAL
jgi:ATP-binding protein involved in chromosome partitioning